jgi:hypothetical protein
VLAILATLSATEVVDSGYWTFVDDFIRFRYPLDWTVQRMSNNVVNVTNTSDAFLGLSGQALVQVVTLPKITGNHFFMGAVCHRQLLGRWRLGWQPT